MRGTRVVLVKLRAGTPPPFDCDAGLQSAHPVQRGGSTSARSARRGAERLFWRCATAPCFPGRPSGTGLGTAWPEPGALRQQRGIPQHRPCRAPAAGPPPPPSVAAAAELRPGSGSGRPSLPRSAPAGVPARRGPAGVRRMMLLPIRRAPGAGTVLSWTVW